MFGMKDKTNKQTHKQGDPMDMIWSLCAYIIQSKGVGKAYTLLREGWRFRPHQSLCMGI